MFRFIGIMYKRVESQLVLVGLTKKDQAKVAGMGYNTLLAKLRGEREFTLREARVIKEAIKSDESIETLFERVA